MDFCGCLARGFAFISLLSTRHFPPLAGSTLNLEPPRRFANRIRYVLMSSKFNIPTFRNTSKVLERWQKDVKAQCLHQEVTRHRVPSIGVHAKTNQVHRLCCAVCQHLFCGTMWTFAGPVGKLIARLRGWFFFQELMADFWDKNLTCETTILFLFWFCVFVSFMYVLRFVTLVVFNFVFVFVVIHVSKWSSWKM